MWKIRLAVFAGVSLTLWGPHSANSEQISVPGIETVLAEPAPHDGGWMLPPAPSAKEMCSHEALAPAAHDHSLTYSAEALSKHPAVNWSKVPVITKVEWSGWFTPSSSGPGYYSLFDEIHGRYLEQAPPPEFGATGSNQTPSYDYDFRYLDNPHNTYHMWSDAYKRVLIDEDFLFSTGGEYRYRYNHYTNSQLTGVTESFDYSRLRIYGDLWYRDQIRLFVEMIDARTLDGTFPASGGVQTGTDFLNGFTEWKIDELHNTPVQLRVGRQEVVMGSQRLIASPDFSNTLRNYDGIRGFWHSTGWDVDLFWIRPVIPDPHRIDSSDENRSLSGLFMTRHPSANSLIDLYLLNLNDTRPTTDGNTVTLGTRVAGDVNKRLLYEVELMTQFGERDGDTVNAQSSTTGLGWQFTELPWNVSFWAYFDYASGTRDPGSDKYHTFNQLFPAGHTYFGYLDLVGRQNIEDWNFQLQFYPKKWLQMRIQYHIFHLASSRDALYNAGGAPIRQDITGAAGNDVGNEIDLMSNVHLNDHQNLVFGYSRLFSGRFIRETGPGRDPEYAYAQYDIRW